MANSVILNKHFEKYGFDADFFNKYEDSAKDEMQNLTSMCNILHGIYNANLQIVIYTDFDVDGIMSSVVAYAGLSELGFNVRLHRPTPSKGYGFTKDDVDDICNLYPEASVILTGDVGIGCNSTVAYARNKGLCTLITDHHIGHAPAAAECTVNPNQTNETYSHKDICGSFVLYQIIKRYADLYGTDDDRFNIEKLQLFAGIATISDVMPLLYENRPLVRESIRLLRELYISSAEKVTEGRVVRSSMYNRAFVGMKKLLDYFVDERKIRSIDDLTEQFYGYYLVPFLNSCKRMDGNMHAVYDIFFSPHVNALADFPNMSCVQNGISYMAILNEQRKIVTAQYYDELLNTNDEKMIELMRVGIYVTTAPAGILGLLATKFETATGLPSFVVNRKEDGSYVGSGRNPSWFDLRQKLSMYNIRFECAGHNEAFGIRIADEMAIDEYKRFHQSVVMPSYLIAMENAGESPVVTIAYDEGFDCDFTYDDTLIREFLDDYERYHPYGKSFPAPSFDLCFNSDVQERILGCEGKHIKLTTRDGFEILLFNMAVDYERLKAANKDRPYRLVCNGMFQYNTFRGETKVNFVAKSVGIV